jgi:hypothetical protein
VSARAGPRRAITRAEAERLVFCRDGKFYVGVEHVDGTSEGHADRETAVRAALRRVVFVGTPRAAYEIADGSPDSPTMMPLF